MRTILFAAFLAAISCLIFGQSDHGSIIGIISDPNTRLVQGARVEAKSIETGKAYSAESNDTGHYRITALPTGTYEVSVTLPQFDEVRVKGVKAGELQPARVDIVLKAK